MNKPLRWLLGFRGLVWSASIALALYLLLGPLVQNYWAGGHWIKVPCYVSKDFGENGYYYYAFPPGEHAQYYRAIRRDFWSPRGYVDSTLRTTFPDSEGRTCYVNPNNPKDPVLYLDADSHLDRGWKCLMIAVLVLVVALGVTIWSPGSKTVRRAAPPGR